MAALERVRDNLTKLKTSARGGRPTRSPSWTRPSTPSRPVSGISGALLSDLPTIVGDLERIDTAWKALDQQITQTCPTGG